MAGNSGASTPVLVREVTLTSGATFQISNTKIYAPVITLSTNDIITILEHLKQGFKRTISRNKYRSAIATQSKSSNLNYLIDPTFSNINSLFALSFKNGGTNPTRNSFHAYDMPLVEIK